MEISVMITVAAATATTRTPAILMSVSDTMSTAFAVSEAPLPRWDNHTKARRISRMSVAGAVQVILCLAGTLAVTPAAAGPLRIAGQTE